MLRIKILNKTYEAPKNLSEVPLSRFRKYILGADKHEPKDPVRRIQVSRPKKGLFGWVSKLEDKINGKEIQVLYSEDPEENERILQAWDDFARWEVGFWFKIGKSVLSQVPQEDIDQMHQFLGSYLVPPDPEPGFSSFSWRGKAYFLDYEISDVSDLADLGMGNGSFLQLLSRILKDQKRGAFKANYFRDLPTDIAFQVAASFEDRAKVAQGYVGKLLQDSVLYKKGTPSDLAEQHDHYFPFWEKTEGKAWQGQ